MARTIGRLNALTIARATEPGLYGDGGGLYLQISPTGGKSWLYRFTLRGKTRGMGLGPLHIISLKEARECATAARRLRFDGIDPIEARKAERGAAAAETARAMTFRECATGYIEAHRPGWKNPKHAAQWTATLETYAYPIIGDVPPSAIDTAMVTKILEPIWSTKTETASRVRGRIESVLDWAKVRGYRDGENPARWRGHLDNLLPARGKVQKVQHHAALGFDDIAAFVGELRTREGIAARALEFAILTAARTGEVIGATWGEIDLGARIWTVPAERMKASREHRAPLSDRALAILQGLDGRRDPADFVFRGATAARPLSNVSMLAVLRRMDRADLTTHGFRSAFRDWAAERTNFPRDVAEMALAHAIGDKVEAAYRRGDLFEKRRRLMDAWAKFCAAASVAAGPASIATLRAST